MTRPRLLLLGSFCSPGSPLHGQAQDPADLDSMASALQAAANRDEPVLALCGRLDAAALTPTLHRARTAVPGAVTAVHVSTLPPLSRHVLATMGQVLAGQLGLGQLVAALQLLESRMLSLAVLGRLGGLREPNPSVVLHALSWLPGSQFLVQAGRPGRVSRLHRRRPPVLAVPIEDPAARVLAVSRQHAARAFDLLVQTLPCAAVMDYAASPESSRWWGTEDAAELCLAPLDLARTIDDARAACTRCPWCEQPSPPGPCPACGHLTGPAGPGPAAFVLPAAAVLPVAPPGSGGHP